MFRFSQRDDSSRLIIAHAMRKHVGNQRRHSLDSLAARTGIKRRTLQSYLQGQASPPYGALVKLMHELDEPFVNDLLHPAGFSGATRLTNEAPDDMRLVAIMTGTSAEIADAYATSGKVCHVRWPKVREKLALAFRHIGARLRQTEIRA